MAYEGFEDALRRTNGIHDAVVKGNLSLVKRLLKDGMDIDIPCYFGRSPLLYACEHGHVAIVRFLLKHGASRRNDILYSACAPEHLMMAPHNEKSAACSDALTILALLLDDRNPALLDIPSPRASGMTPLHLAASSGHLHFITALLDHGADVNSLDMNRGTALHVALSAGQLAAAKLLCQSGAKLNLRNRWGEDAFDVASRQKIDIRSLLPQGSATRWLAQLPQQLPKGR